MPWMLALAAWPVLLLAVPTQSFLVEMAGLRGHIFFLPFIALGAMLTDDDLSKIAYSIANLNFIALIFAMLEAQFGLLPFFPVNKVDDIIYRSSDVFVGTIRNFRLPGTFENAASYGNNMVASLPFLIGALVQGRSPRPKRFFLLAIACSAIGVFLSASRTSVVFLFTIMLGTLLSGRFRDLPKFGWIAMAAIVALLVSSNARFQRFLTLGDTKYLKTRISGSVNDTILNLMVEYPMGNGLGGGGTSMPYFLESQVQNPVRVENEYGRILLEQGIPGLLLWLSFAGWILTRPTPRLNWNWSLGKWLARVAFAFSFATAPLGTGLLTAIPGTATLLLFAGWIATPQFYGKSERAPSSDAERQ
jgi:hypothetical protein